MPVTFLHRQRHICIINKTLAMKLKITITILTLAIGSISFAAPFNSSSSKISVIQAQWTHALQHETAHSNLTEMQKVGVLFTIDEHNKVKILNLAGANKEMYNHVKQQLNGLDNITELRPNEVYRIDISFQVV